MSEDFLAVIKLISGEEIVASVCYFEDEKSLMVDCPIIMKSEMQKQMGVNVVRVEPWIKSTNETLYMIPLDKIITISEIMDSQTTKMYNKFISGYYYKETNEPVNKITKEMGYISTVNDARASLENLYKNK